MRLVLIIEDSVTDAYLFREAIHDCGIDIIISIVPTWLEAQAIVIDMAYTLSLILLDLNLPGVGGKEIIHLIRERGIMIPIIVFSTSSSPNDIYECYREGANAYIIKPYDIEQLFEVMCTTFKWWLEINNLGGEI